MLDELDLDDPLFARVRAARPAPPPSLTAAVTARLPIRRRTPALALGLALAVACGALVVLMLPAGERRAVIGGAPKHAAPIGAGPVVDAAPRVSAETQVRAWMLALHKGDLDAANRMTSTSLVHLWPEDDKHPAPAASNAKAVHDALAHIASVFPFVRADWGADSEVGVHVIAGADLDAALHKVRRPFATSFGPLAKTDTIVRVDIRVHSGGAGDDGFAPDAAYLVAVTSTPSGPKIEGVIELYITSD